LGAIEEDSSLFSGGRTTELGPEVSRETPLKLFVEYDGEADDEGAAAFEN
jgi:hypothetical protein